MKILKKTTNQAFETYKEEIVALRSDEEVRRIIDTITPNSMTILIYQMELRGFELAAARCPTGEFACSFFKTPKQTFDVVGSIVPKVVAEAALVALYG